MTDCPLPKRSSIHDPSFSNEPAHDCPLPSRLSGGSRRVSSRNWVAVGAGVAVITLGAPLAGFASTGQADSSGDKILGTFAGERSWGGSESTTFSDQSELNAVTAAASRAKVRTPIEVSACVAADQSADGARGITQKFAAVWPLQEGSYTETSSFSWRVSPISGELLMHEGVDWAASSGTPIYAAAAGTVTDVGYNGRSGNFLEITHELSDGSVYTSYYMHQADGAIAVSVGQQVEAGEQIGGVGSTGWSTGAHLHFEVRDGADNPVDPISFLSNLDAAYPGQACQ